MQKYLNSHLEGKIPCLTSVGLGLGGWGGLLVSKGGAVGAGQALLLHEKAGASVGALACSRKINKLCILKEGERFSTENTERFVCFLRFTILSSFSFFSM